MWEDLKPSQIEVPMALLRKIANELNAITKQALIFTVESDVYHDFPDLAELMPSSPAEDSKRILRLCLYAPSLNGFTMYLVSIVNDIKTIYPCDVTDLINKKSYNVKTYAELEKDIRLILDNVEVKSVISNLWGQALL